MQQANTQSAQGGRGEESIRRVKRFRYENGRLYFSKQTERSIFFVLTVVMLIWGVIEGVSTTGG
ncbi:MAG: hypothetical protein AB7E32_06480 [Desulfovibrio sp.]